MSHHHSNTGEKIGENVRGVFTGLHGTGEVLRGNVMGAMDSLFHDKDARARDEEMVRKGEIQVRDEQRRLEELRGHQQGQGHQGQYLEQQHQGQQVHQPPPLPPREHVEEPVAGGAVSGHSSVAQAAQSQVHDAPHASGKVTGQGSHFH